MPQLQIQTLGLPHQRGVNLAAALAEEQLKYAQQIAQSVVPSGHTPDQALIGALVVAIATNYAAGPKPAP
jgi:hypothetical protein